MNVEDLAKAVHQELKKRIPLNWEMKIKQGMLTIGPYIIWTRGMMGSFIEIWFEDDHARLMLSIDGSKTQDKFEYTDPEFPENMYKRILE